MARISDGLYHYLSGRIRGQDPAGNPVNHGGVPVPLGGVCGGGNSTDHYQPLGRVVGSVAGYSTSSRGFTDGYGGQLTPDCRAVAVGRCSPLENGR